MKVISKNCVYVQREDIVNLESLPIVMPLSIYMKYFKSGANIVNDFNKYQFIRFDDEEEIEFFKGLDCIVDYQSVKNLSVDDLMKLGKYLSQESKDILNKYETMSDDEKLENCSLYIKHELLEYKIHSIAVILWIRFKIIHINMPDENKANYHEANGIKRLIKKVLK